MNDEREVSPVLLALSDVLVLVALERAASRSLPGSVRRTIPASQRHRAYELHPIPEAKMDQALTDAWSSCSLVAARHDLEVSVTDWVALLDSYTRTLILMGQNHTPRRLRPHLLRLTLDYADAERQAVEA